jgi:hypothetical protein
MNLQLSQVQGQSALAPAPLLGRKLIELIKVFFQKVSWMFWVWHSVASQILPKLLLPRHALTVLPVCAQIFIWNLVVFLPQPVEAVSLIVRQEVQQPANSFFDVWFGSVIKLLGSGIRQSRNLVAYENTKTVFAGLNSSNISIVNQETATNKSSDNSEIWDSVAQAMFGVILVIFMFAIDKQNQEAFRPNSIIHSKPVCAIG